MQMFGVGILELMVIMILAVVVVGPDRLPTVAGDLARWIRRARAYGQHLTRDFNDVIADLEKEVGATREDWKEIASVVTHHTGGLTRELEKVAGQIERSIDISEPQVDPSNVVPFESRPASEIAAEEMAAGEAPATKATGAAPAEAGQPPPEAQNVEDEKPWFVPEKPATRRRRSE
jgi:sec-independent protein translocase protein TatB